MRQAIHHHYDQLSASERFFVDDVFDKAAFELGALYGVPLAGDDRVERAVDALARAVIESRPKAERPASIIDNMRAMDEATGSPTGQKGEPA